MIKLCCKSVVTRDEENGLSWNCMWAEGWLRRKMSKRPVETLFVISENQRERKMFYLTTHSTHFIYGYMASDIWFRTILIVRKETRCRHIGYSYRLTARVLLYAPSHRQDNTYHGLCYTSRGARTPWRIDPTTHRTMSERSTYELRPAP